MIMVLSVRSLRSRSCNRGIGRSILIKLALLIEFRLSGHVQACPYVSCFADLFRKGTAGVRGNRLTFVSPSRIMSNRCQAKADRRRKHVSVANSQSATPDELLTLVRNKTTLDRDLSLARSETVEL